MSKRIAGILIFTIVLLCAVLPNAMAASGMLKGFFRDVKRPDGAVIGTTYEQATDEIAINKALT